MVFLLRRSHSPQNLRISQVPSTMDSDDIPLARYYGSTDIRPFRIAFRDRASAIRQDRTRGFIFSLCAPPLSLLGVALRKQLQGEEYISASFYL
jgi:hypothetical protein